MKFKWIRKQPEGPVVLKQRGKVVGVIVKVGRQWYKFSASARVVMGLDLHQPIFHVSRVHTVPALYSFPVTRHEGHELIISSSSRCILSIVAGSRSGPFA